VSKPKQPHEYKQIPAFASEMEEILFWDEHDPLEYFSPEPTDIIFKLKSQRKKMVSVRIDEGLHEELKQVAAENGIPYQKLMRELLRQSLVRLRRAKATSPTT
jgi:predicted DNA binding CopG/RHH family protein